MTQLLLGTHGRSGGLNDDPRLLQAFIQDPFDRLMVCQSRVAPLLLLSVDCHLQSHGKTVKVVAFRDRQGRASGAGGTTPFTRAQR